MKLDFKKEVNSNYLWQAKTTTGINEILHVLAAFGQRKLGRGERRHVNDLNRTRENLIH